MTAGKCEPIIVTIDGPAGAGKSTVARELARELGFKFLDTGAMYRAVALAVLENDVDFEDQERVIQIAQPLELFVDGEITKIGERDVSDSIRTREISEGASRVAAIPGIRKLLVEQQRQIASSGNFVCEGRDQGSVVFPDAAFKFFITASIKDRARRRLKELHERGYSFSLKEIVAEQVERDERDASRSVGALQKAKDAMEISTDTMTIKEVVEFMLKVIWNETRNCRVSRKKTSTDDS